MVILKVRTILAKLCYGQTSCNVFRTYIEKGILNSINTMDIVKSQWGVSGRRIHIGVPIEKIDHERRLVSGWATLDNVDKTDDVVTAEASARAFERFRGNIREMHQPIAAGRMVDFREESFYHREDDTFYSGIYVTAYVSKGAEDTWEKVLDGTLSGFSIGGNIKEESVEYIPELERAVRFIHDYDLIELSLVDNPANQLANVFEIVKSEDGSKTMKGMAVDTELVNVFWCEADEVAKNSPEESLDCHVCDTSMEQIGWIERGMGEVEKTVSLVNDFLSKKEEETETTLGEGGVEVTDKTEKNEAATEEELSLGEFVGHAVGVFADRASDEDWVSLIGALGNAEDPGRTCLKRMVEFALLPPRQQVGCGHHHA
jgi:hypothetical protein